MCQLETAPAKGTRHLPLQLNPVLLQLLTFDTPRREFRVESEAHTRETGGTGLSVQSSRSVMSDPM